jgi:hypothetical protein
MRLPSAKMRRVKEMTHAYQDCNSKRDESRERLSDGMLEGREGVEVCLAEGRSCHKPKLWPEVAGRRQR